MSGVKNKGFAMDGSDPSMKAADYAIALAGTAVENGSTELIALHVIHSEIKYVYMQNSVEGVIEDAKKEAQKWFDKVEANADKNKVRLRKDIIVDSRTLIGAIVDYAEHESIDLVVIGSRGMSGFKKILLGSTIYLLRTLLNRIICPLI